jgi:hypothetical protein
MCYSAAASFSAAAVLIPTGAVCAKWVIRQHPSYLPVALIPTFFGIQQCIEGFVWIGLRRNQPALTTPASVAFLFFALAFWPFWVPFSAAMAEPRPWKRRLIAALTLAAGVFGATLITPILLHPEKWLTTAAVCHSVQYDYENLPLFQYIAHDVERLLYLVFVIVPLLLCSDRRLRIFGVLMLVSAVAARIVFHYAFASVWCFCAALLATYLCHVTWRLRA